MPKATRCRHPGPCARGAGAPARPAPAVPLPTRPAHAAAVLLAAVLIGAVTALPAGAGLWQWPLPGRPEVTRAFTPPTTPYGPGHRGVDLAGRPGTVVRAAGAGIVGYAGLLAGRGVVSVLHDAGLRTTYEPVLPVVRSGQRVMVGQQIGSLAPGHLGCRLGCLHWGLLRGRTYLDPLSLLGAGRVRLLPGPVPSSAAAAPSVAVRPAPAGTGRSAGGGRASWPPGASLAATFGLALVPLGVHRVIGRRRAPPGVARARAG